jgi:hypothetical protein
VLVAVLVAGFVAPAAWSVAQETDGRDFASFHYAARVWQQGGDPYDPGQLAALARADGTRGAVYPFFYPPPALPMLAWTGWTPLLGGHRLMAALNLVALAGLGAVLWRWLKAPPWLVVLLLATSSGAVETARLGQVNGVLALLVGLGLWQGRGAPVGLAALLKMSPAILLFRQIAARDWRPVLVAAATGATGLLATLLVVDVGLYERFFLDVLPQMGDGGWNGLDVPLSFRANHSLPGLLDRVFPSPDDVHLHPTARLLGTAASGAGLLGVCWLGRHRRDALGEGLVWGALHALMVITPVYSWEHHHVLLMLPMAAIGVALLEGRLPRWAWSLFGLCLAIWAWRQPWWRAAWRAAPSLRLVIEESKLLLPLLVLGLSAWGGARSPIEEPVS